MKKIWIAILLVCLAAAAVAQNRQGRRPARNPDETPRPVEIRRGMVFDPSAPGSRGARFFDGLAKEVAPDGKPNPEMLAHYIDFLKSRIVEDRHLYYFNVTGRFDTPTTVVLSGDVGYEELKNSPARFIRALGYGVVNDINVLPDSALGEKRFGIVSIPYMLTYDGPTTASEKMNEGLLGDHLYLLKEGKDGYFLCQTTEGYVSYLHKSAFQRVDDKELGAWMNARKVTLIENVQTPAGMLPLSARLPLVKQSGDSVEVRLPDGKKQTLKSSQVRLPDPDLAKKREQLARTAKSQLGTKYVWGGRSPEGIDCSGFIMVNYRALGIYLPRDAYQQFVTGELVGTRWFRGALQPGDALYFVGGNGRITHTALYLGDGRIIHASHGDVHYGSINPSSPDYDENNDERFLFAKRFME